MQVSNGVSGSSFGLAKDGTLWAWGLNGGNLGTGDLVHRSSPVQIGSFTSWSSISGGNDGNYGLTSGNQLYSWGGNTFGDLGLGDITARSTPVLVSGGNSWSYVRGGAFNAAALTTDKRLFCWGDNRLGQLGLGDSSPRSSPTQVGSLNNWKEISHFTSSVLALKIDGTLWSWGANYTGELGIGIANSHRSSPVQIGALNTWRKIGTAYLSGYAISSDKSLWSWGYNLLGELGQGDVVIRSSPVQVGALTNWYIINYNNNTSESVFSIKTDGTLWAWGDNRWGALGFSDATHRSSPTQVGALTTWKYVASSGQLNTTLAISA